jgi:hypothetical protein
MILLTLLQGGTEPAIVSLTGIVASHAWFYLTQEYPVSSCLAVWRWLSNLKAHQQQPTACVHPCAAQAGIWERRRRSSVPSRTRSDWGRSTSAAPSAGPGSQLGFGQPPWDVAQRVRAPMHRSMQRRIHVTLRQSQPGVSMSRHCRLPPPFLDYRAS